MLARLLHDFLLCTPMSFHIGDSVVGMRDPIENVFDLSTALDERDIYHERDENL